MELTEQAVFEAFGLEQPQAQAEQAQTEAEEVEGAQEQEVAEPADVEEEQTAEQSAETENLFVLLILISFVLVFVLLNIYFLSFSNHHTSLLYHVLQKKCRLKSDMKTPPDAASRNSSG